MFSRFFVSLFLVSSANAQLSFGPSQEISDYINSPRHVRAVDMDSDGDKDILAAENFGARVLWWENDGNGVFSNRREWIGNPMNSILSLQDYDGDGRPDIWTVKYRDENGEDLYELWVADGLGDGGFAEPILRLAATGYSHSFEEVIDVNNDGRLDILSKAGVYLRQADGSFSHPPAVAEDDPDPLGELLSDSGPGFRALGNFDNSGAPIFLYPTEYEEYVTEQNSIASCTPEGETRIVFSFEDDEDIEWLSAIPPDSNETLDRVVVVVGKTLAEDGYPYVLSRRIVLITFLPDGTAIEGSSIPLENAGMYWWGSPQDAIWDPVRGELLMAWDTSGVTHQSTLSWISFDPPSISPAFSFAGYMLGLSMVDLNGDGRDDLLAPLSPASTGSAPFYDHITWHTRSESGAFEPEPRSISQPAFSKILQFAGDIDGDGDGDVITSGGYPIGPRSDLWSQQLFQWKNFEGKFTREVISDDHDWISVIQVRDFNGDSRKDLLVDTYDLLYQGGYAGTQRYYRLEQQPSGGFNFVNLYENVLESRDEVLSVIDWNRDGIDDIIVRRFELYQYVSVIYCIPGDHEGFPDQGKIPLVYSNSYNLSVIDIDRDGDPDLVGTLDYFVNSAYWVENNGEGEVSTIRKIPHEFFSTAGDLDGDGHEDFRGLEAYFLSRPGVTFESVPSNLPQDWIGEFVYLDMDQDDDADLLRSLAESGWSEFRSLGWLENRGDGRVELGEVIGLNGESNTVPARPIDGPRWSARDQAAMADIDGDGTADLVVVSSANPRVEWFKATRKAEHPIYTAWMEARELRGNSAGPGEDWDRDGIANWSEFAYGSDPGLSDPGHPGRPRMEKSDGSLSFAFQKRADAATLGLIYPMERGIDLIEWNEWTPSVNVGPGAEGYEKVTVPVNADQPKEFFRIALPDAP